MWSVDLFDFYVNSLLLVLVETWNQWSRIVQIWLTVTVWWCLVQAWPINLLAILISAESDTFLLVLFNPSMCFTSLPSPCCIVSRSQWQCLLTPGQLCISPCVHHRNVSISHIIYRVSQKKWWQDSMTKTIRIISIKGSKLPRKVLPPFFLGHPVAYIG